MAGQGPKRPLGSILRTSVTSVSAPALATAPALAPTCEPLSCVACRDRKLRCGRETGACARCVKSNVECVYPESRRKVTVRRRQAHQLEARLAHVEDVLAKSTKVAKPEEAVKTAAASGGPPAVTVSDESTEASPQAAIPTQGFGDPVNDGCFSGPEPNIAFGLDGFSGSGHGATPSFDSDFAAQDNIFDNQLMGMGMFEAAPPFGMVEELHNWYFEHQHDIIPIVHPARYLQAYHSIGKNRPPMCLQYAIWAIAANDHPKYHSYHEVFYRRARQYLEADELRGEGEHFVTVAHAQAWIFMATYEVWSLRFTPAAMSCARAVRLCNIMGLHRLDDPEYKMQMMPTLLPAQSWLELEERRRTFWAAFCINSHISIYSGWPGIIDSDMISTNLPCSEEAFRLGEEEKTGKLPTLFLGGGMSHSHFASAVGVCHIFNLLLAHVNRIRANDGVGDLEHGAFWKRHREIDSLLICLMSLTASQPYREGDSIGDDYHNRRQPIQVDNRLGGSLNMRLNLHASVICLHMEAIGRVEAHGLAPDIRRTSQLRLLLSAHEMVKIMRMVAAASTQQPVARARQYQHRSPLAALALYCAGMVYMMLIREAEGGGGGGGDHNGDNNHQPSSEAAWPGCRENLDYVVRRTEVVARAHPVARAFFLQLILDLEHHDIEPVVKVPSAESDGSKRWSHTLPILVHRFTSRREVSAAGSPPQWLPFIRPLGCAKSTSSQWVGRNSGSSNLSALANHRRGSGFIVEDGAPAVTPVPRELVPPARATTPSPFPPNSEDGRGKRRRVDPRGNRSPQVMGTMRMPSFPHLSDASDLDSSGRLWTSTPGDDPNSAGDGSGLDWAEQAGMEAFTRELVEANDSADCLGHCEGAVDNGGGAGASIQDSSGGILQKMALDEIQPWMSFF